jgi:hypothetical protein
MSWTIISWSKSQSVVSGGNLRLDTNTPILPTHYKGIKILVRINVLNPLVTKGLRTLVRINL